MGGNPSPVSRTFVVKALGLPEVTRLGLICELFGNLLAREVGVTTPAPALVDIDADAADALNTSLAPRGLSIQPGLAVGCMYLRPLLPFGGSLPDEVTAEIPRLIVRMDSISPFRSRSAPGQPQLCDFRK
jgi:hypothetical protein